MAHAWIKTLCLLHCIGGYLLERQLNIRVKAAQAQTVEAEKKQVKK